MKKRILAIIMVMANVSGTLCLRRRKLFSKGFNC